MIAVVLAGQRPGGDPLARGLNVEHKAVLPIGGVPMLARVVDALKRTPSIDRIEVVTDNFGCLAGIDGIESAAAEASPSLSVAAALARNTTPILITTADHALLAPAHIEELVAECPNDVDLAVGMVGRRILEVRFPSAKRTYWRFRDDSFSGANLFLLNTPKAEAALQFWRHVEANRKRPWQIVKTLNWRLLFDYALKRRTMAEAIAQAGRALGIRAAGVALSDAIAAVDVDKVEDVALVEAILSGEA